jgi:NAD+ synthase (glutamine-hydrolysing)
MTTGQTTLRVAVLQTAPRREALAENAGNILQRAVDADLIVTPELSLTGYDLRDAVHDLAITLDRAAGLPAVLDALAAGDRTLTVGLVEKGEDGIPYNSAVALGSGRILHRHRKIYLPTYGLFDEGRYFGRGTGLECFEVNGWRVAILICEDLWHPALPYLAALAGAGLIVVMAAAPGRGVFEGGDDGATFASHTAWTDLVRVTARTHGLYVALCNRVGVEDGVTFAGGSQIAGPDGRLLARAPSNGEHRIDAVLTRDELARARRPFAHARDENAELVLRALLRQRESR